MPFLDMSAPELRGLNEGAFKAPLVSTAQIVDLEGFQTPTPIRLENPLPDLRFGAQVGVEFRWDSSARHAFFIGLGSWEQTVASNVVGTFSLEGAFAQVVNERKGTFSFTEYYLGWRYLVRDKPGRYRIGTRLSINEIFDIDYREDIVYNYTSGPAAGFRRIVIQQAQTTGMLALKLSFDGEYFLTEWASIDLNVGYMFGLRDPTLVDYNSRSDFRPTDNIGTGTSTIREGPTTGVVEYLDSDGVTYRPLDLTFDGWLVGVGFRLYY